MASKWDKYKVTEEENKWDKYKTTPQQSGQQSYQESVDPKRNNTEGLLSPARAAVGVLGALATPINFLAKGVDAVTGTKISQGIDDTYKGAQDAITQGNQAVNQWAGAEQGKNAERKEGWNLVSGVTDPLGWATKELPSAVANAATGASQFFGGAKNTFEGEIDTAKNLVTGQWGDAAKSATKGIQGLSDIWTGALGVMGAPAPLLPDFIEKPTMHAFGAATTGVDNVAKFGMEKMGIDPDSQAGAIISQNIQNAFATILLKKAPQINEAVGGAMKGAFRKVVAPLEKSYDAAAGAAFKEAGITPTPSMVSNSRAVVMLETMQSKGLFGQGLLNVQQKAVADIRGFVQQHAEAISKNTTPLEAGETMIKQFASFKKGFREKTTPIYEEVARKTQGAPALLDNTNAFLEKVSSSLNESSIKNPIAPTITGIMDDFKAGRTFNELQATRSDLLSIIREAKQTPGGKQNVALLEKLADTMTKDMDATVSKISPELGQTLQTVNTAYRETMEKLNSHYGNEIFGVQGLKKSVGPENLVDRLIKPKQHSDIPVLLEILQEDGANALRGGFIAKLAKESITGSTGQFSPTKFASALERYGDDTIRALFTDEQYRNIQLVKKMSQSYTKSQEIAKGSQTAFVAKAGATIGAIPVGFAMGKGFETVAGVLGMAVLDYGFSKFMESNFARQYLGEGFFKHIEQMKANMGEGVQSGINSVKAGVNQYTDDLKQNTQGAKSTRGSVVNPFGTKSKLPPHLQELADKMNKKMNEKGFSNKDVTPEGYGPSIEKSTPKKIDLLRGENLDQAIARKIGYQIDNGVVKLTQTKDGWKATIASLGEGGPKVIQGYSKQQVLNETFKHLNPDVSFKVPTPQSSLLQEAKKYKSADEFVKSHGTPATVKIWVKSKFSNDGGYMDVPVLRKEENITLYQGGNTGDSRQFWTPNKKYASQFGDVKEKTGTFYKIDNGNRTTDVYVDAKSQLTDIYNQAHGKN